MKKKIAGFIYLVGVFVVFYLLTKAIVGGNTVKFPDSMIPFTEFERYSVFLGLVCIPMLVSCFLFIKAYAIKTIKTRLLVFVPGIITAIPFVYGVGLIIVMLVLGVKDAAGFSA
jgi:hypothetical protein